MNNKLAITLTLLSFLIVSVFMTTAPVSAIDPEGTISARVIFVIEPVHNWLKSQNYTITIQIKNNGLRALPDSNTSDNLFPTGNISVDIALNTVANKPDLSINVAGSTIEHTFEIVSGAAITMNKTSVSVCAIALPLDNQWHDIATYTCYYNVPTLPFANKELNSIMLDYNINICADEYELPTTSSPTPDGVGWGITVTYQGSSIGHSYYEYTLYEEPTPTPTPIASPTVSPIPTPTPVTSATQVLTKNPTPMPTSAPIITPAPKSSSTDSSNPTNPMTSIPTIMSPSATDETSSLTETTLSSDVPWVTYTAIIAVTVTIILVALAVLLRK